MSKNRRGALLVLCQEISAELEQRRIPHALKGGTALKIGYGLIRPSTDADFEGDEKVVAKELVQAALKTNKEYELVRTGVNWFGRGSISVTMKDRKTNEKIKIGFDYRMTGTLPGMPDRIPEEDVVTIAGIKMYNIRTMAARKLNTLIGDKPREEARDIFDAAFLVEQYRKELSDEIRSKLNTWAKGVTGDKKKKLEAKFRKDGIMRRSSLEDTLEIIREGTSKEEEGATYTDLKLAANTEVPEDGPVSGDIKKIYEEHPNRIVALMMGTGEGVIFGLSTMEREVTPLYQVVSGKESQFEQWLRQYRELWGEPLKKADTSGKGAGHVVKQYREMARQTEKARN